MPVWPSLGKPTQGEILRTLVRLELLVQQLTDEKASRAEFQSYKVTQEKEFEVFKKNMDEVHRVLAENSDEVRGWIISAVRLIIFVVITAIVSLVIIRPKQ